MKYILTTILTLTILTAQEGEVTNVVAEQRTDGSQIVDVTYDLLPDSDFASFTVFAYISLDEGETFEQINAANPSFLNALGSNVLPGTNKTFYWIHENDFPAISSDNIIFKITAFGHEAVSLPGSFELMNVPSGDFMGFYYNSTDNGPNNLHPDNAVNTLMTIDYDYQIMKNLVTNAQFLEFLLILVDLELITVGANGIEGSVDYNFDPSVNPYPVSLYNESEINQYGWNQRIYFARWEPNNAQRLYMNGTTYLIEEGYGDHPVQGVSPLGMQLFAEYYGLRLPMWKEYIKASRGMQTGDYVWGSECDWIEGGGGFISPRVNHGASGDTWESSENNSNTTPVGYYNGTNYSGFQTIDIPSAYGLYDIHGNIRELVAWETSCYSESNCQSSTSVNSFGVTGYKPFLFQRGGQSTGSAYYHNPCADFKLNYWDQVWNQDYYSGFRCARTVVIDN